MQEMLNQSRRLFSIITILFSLNLVVGQSVAGGQSGDTLVIVTQPIPIENVIQKISLANDDVKIIRRKIGQNQGVKRIDSLFPAYAKFLKSQEQVAEKFIKSNPNRQKINNQIRIWEGYKNQLSSWEISIDEYEERNVSLLEGIKIDQRIWELTYKNALQENVPRELQTNVKKTRDEYQYLGNEIRVGNNKLLILESRINKQKRLINSVVENLNTLKASENYDLFYLRHEVIWNSDFSSSEQEASKGFADSFTVNFDAFFKYINKVSKSFFWFFILIGGIIMFLKWLAKGYDKYEFKEEKKSLVDAKDILTIQFRWSAVFISLLFAWYFFDNQPMVFTDLLILGLLVVAVPIVKPHVSANFVALLFFVIVIYVLDTAKTYIWFSSSVYRIFLMSEAFLVFIILFKYTFKPLKQIKIQDFQFKSLLIKLSPVFQLLAVISIISNMFGYTNLADLTLKICTQTGVYALIFYVIALVSGGISTAILHLHYYSREKFSYQRKVFMEVKSIYGIRWIVLILWILVMLDIIDLLQPLQVFFTDMLTDPYSFGNITITIGDILQFVLILGGAFIITSIVSFFFDSGKIGFTLVKLPKGIPAAISLVIRYFIIATGIVFALSSLGIDLSKFNLMAGALGLGIGFGLQNIISNFVSGLILVFERPILVGDTIEVNSLLGTVNRIGVRSSNISTFDGAEVVVPNSNLISNDLINWTLSDSMKRVEILIGVSYGTDPNKVLDILLAVLKDMDNILKEPEPHALFSEFGDSSLNFRLRFWVPYTIGLQAKSEVSIAIYNKFKEHDIEIPFPQRDINIKSVPPEKKEE